MTPALSFKGVTFAFPGATPAVEGVDLDVAEHEFIGLIGPNGGGKSTLLKLAAGLLRPDAGQVRVFGRAPADARDEIGYVPQFAGFPRDFPITVEQAVQLGRLGGQLGLRWKAPDQRALEELVVREGLQELAHQRSPCPGWCPWSCP